MLVVYLGIVFLTIVILIAIKKTTLSSNPWWSHYVSYTLSNSYW